MEYKLTSVELAAARRLLGNDAIIGVTVGSIEEANIACQGGADYLGVGTMFATQTYVKSPLLAFSRLTGV